MRSSIVYRHLKISIQNAVPLQVAAVGEATAEAARHAGLAVALVPETYVAESLAESLAARTRGKKVLLARAAIARDVIPACASRRWRNCRCRRRLSQRHARLRARASARALKEGIDAAAFTSSSSVTHLADAAQKAGIAFPFAGVAAISIGPITSQTLRDLGWEPLAEANPSDVSGLVDAVSLALSRP